MSAGAALCLVFHIKTAFISVCTELYPRKPPGGLPHPATDVLQGNVLICFDDQLVVDMPDDGAVGERAHGVCVGGGSAIDSAKAMREVVSKMDGYASKHIRPTLCEIPVLRAVLTALSIVHQ